MKPYLYAAWNILALCVKAVGLALVFLFMFALGFLGWLS